MQNAFNEKNWISRLSTALRQLSKTQGPFLEKYWQTNGYPTTYTYNGVDETPFPRDDLWHLYEDLRFNSRADPSDSYKPLRAAYDPVCGVLREHPCLSRVLGWQIGVAEFQVGILNGSSLTSLS